MTVGCNLCGGRVGADEGAYICQDCARPREDWLNEIEAFGKLLADEQARVRELEAALADPFELRILADRLDIQDEKAGRMGHEIQDDLRRWAGLSAAALNARQKEEVK